MNKFFLRQLSAVLIITSMHLCSISGFVSAKSPSLSARLKGSDVSSSPCSASIDSGQNFGDRLAALGRQSQNNSLLPVKKSIFKGVPVDYVSTATGEMSFAVNDISFDGSAPLHFQRVYSSNNNEDIGLGKGWSYAFNDKIIINFNKAVLIDGAGESYRYTGLGFNFTGESRTQEFVLTTDEPASVQSFRQIDQNTIKEKNELATKTYEKFGDAFYLTRVNLPGNQEIFLDRLSDGRLSKISNYIGEIKMQWSNGQNPRLLSISDNTGRTVKFQQNSEGLKTVKNALDGQWNYDYSNGKLSAATDAMNRIALQVAYDNDGRAIQSGDSVRRTHFRYESGGQSSAIRTTMTDSLGYALLAEHNANGSLKRVFDEKGYFADFKYDSSNRLTSVADENGQAASFVYDSNDKLTRRFVRNQGEESLLYDEKGNLSTINYGDKKVKITYDGNNLPVEREITRGEISIKVKLDGRGNPVRMETSDGNRTDFEYDDKGREIAATFSDAGRFETAYNATGKKSSEKLPSGAAHNFKYNADNKLTEKTDVKGNRVRADYDRSGALTKVGTEKVWVKNTRDSVGRIIKVESSAGKSRKFRYDARGALIEYVNAKNEKFEFSYDERGKLQMATSPKGVIFGQRKTKRPNEFAFVKSNFSFKSSASVQTDFNSCDTFGNDGFFMDGDTDLTFSVDLSTSLTCDPFGGGVSFGGSGGFGDVGFGEPGSNCYTKCLNSYKQDCYDHGKAEYEKNVTNYVAAGCIGGGGLGTALGAVVGAVIGCSVGAIIGWLGAYQGGGAAEDQCLIEKRGRCREYCVGKETYP